MALGFGNVEVTIIEGEDSTNGANEPVVRYAKNAIVRGGFVLAGDLLRGTATANLSKMAVGTSSTATTSDMTALQAEVFRAVFTDVTDTGGGRISYMLLIGNEQANGNTFREVGLFATDGTMFARVTFDAVTEVEKVEGKQVQIAWAVPLVNV